MSYRFLGAVLIVAGCGGFGTTLILNQKKQEHLLNSFLRGLTYMEQALTYRLTPLPELFLEAGNQAEGEIGNIFQKVSKELNLQVMPDAGGCIAKVLQETRDLPRPLRMLLRKLGSNLGNFDLSGQLESIRELKEICLQQLAELSDGKAQRFRNYETLCICAGLALAILFF